MIVIINGAFGSGKTSAASMLQPFVENSMIFDPEEVGCMLRILVPESLRHSDERTDDFQDLELWRILTVKTAGEIKQKYNKHLIVPMTLYKEPNYSFIYQSLKELDSDLYHFYLRTSEKTLHERLAKRGDAYGGWSYQQAPKCLGAFSDDKFQEHIFTDNLDTFDVVKIILNRIQKDG